MFSSSNKNRKSTNLERTRNPNFGLKQQKSLANNGYPKVETVVTNPPSNKKSETGAEPAAKSQKLEKFAGTASLKSDTKDKEDQPKTALNRSARWHQQFKDQRKLLSKNKKILMKVTFLEGDIEAQREIQSKLDALTAVVPSARTKSACRKIRKFQNWFKMKDKKEKSEKPSTVAAKVSQPAQKKNHQEVKQGLVKDETSVGTKKAQKQAQKKNQQGAALNTKKEEPQSDDDDASDEDASNEGDYDIMLKRILTLRKTILMTTRKSVCSRSESPETKPGFNKKENSDKQSTVAAKVLQPAQKKGHQKVKEELVKDETSVGTKKVQKQSQNKNQQGALNTKKEKPQSDDDDASDEDVPNEGDYDIMLNRIWTLRKMILMTSKKSVLSRSESPETTPGK